MSPLPGNPTAVWTIKRSLADEYDAYIIVSFSNATLVLRWVGGCKLCTTLSCWLASPFVLTHCLVDALSLTPLCCACCPPPPCCSIGETVEEVNDSGFNGNVPTLQTQLLADDSMLQVSQAYCMAVWARGGLGWGLGFGSGWEATEERRSPHFCWMINLNILVRQHPQNNS
jgi:hypothetical protein